MLRTKYIPSTGSVHRKSADIDTLKIVRYHPWQYTGTSLFSVNGAKCSFKSISRTPTSAQV